MAARVGDVNTKPNTRRASAYFAPVFVGIGIGLLYGLLLGLFAGAAVYSFVSPHVTGVRSWRRFLPLLVVLAVSMCWFLLVRELMPPSTSGGVP
jgi:hypothetical protein